MIKHVRSLVLIAIFFSLGSATPAFAATYQYDSLNRLSKVTYDDGTRAVYTYDASGNRSEKIITVSADLNIDTNVDFEDFAQFAQHWLETDCIYPELCGEADFDWSGDVGIDDLSVLVDKWLYRDVLPSNATLNASILGGYGTIYPAYGIYDQGTVVSLTAVPDSGYQVKEWTGTDNNLVRETENTVTMVTDKTVTVEFEPLYTLNSSVLGGNGTIDPVYGEYEYGTVVNLTATPDFDYKIRQWTDTDDDSSKSKTNTVTMNQSKSVSVEFEEIIWPDNSGFEYGNLSGWLATTSGEAWINVIDESLTEGSHSASLQVMALSGAASASLERTVPLQTAGNYTFSFDYKCECYFGGPSATVQLNGISHALVCDGSIKTFSLELENVDSINIVFYAEVPLNSAIEMQIDNCDITLQP